jgi:hypothetical protein
MTTARATVQSVLGTITSVASTITTTFGTVEGVVQMGNELVTNAQRHQKMRNAGLEAIFERRIKAELSAEQATLELTILKQRNSDPEFATLFDQAYTEVEASINEAKSRL